MSPGVDEAGVEIEEIPKMVSSSADVTASPNSEENHKSSTSSKDQSPEDIMDIPSEEEEHVTSPTPDPSRKNIISSEDEDNTNIKDSHPVKKTSYKKVILAEDDEEDDEDFETRQFLSPTSSRTKLLLSDDEDESKNSPRRNKSKVISSDDEDEVTDNHNSSRKKIIISDDEDEELKDSPPIRKLKTISSDEEDGDLPDIHPIKKASHKEKMLRDEEEDSITDGLKASPLKNKLISSADENDDDLPDIHPLSKSSSQPFPGRVLDPNVFGNNSESDDGDRRSVASSRGSQGEDSPWERLTLDVDRNSHPENRSKKQMKQDERNKKKEKKWQQRKASEQAREKNMQELASKTQKMVRDSRVSLPYHKPKQLTLDEFLKKRNKARAPVLSSLINSSSLGSMKHTISMEEDVLPIMAEEEPEVVEERQTNRNEFGGCKVVLDKLCSVEDVGDGFEIKDITAENEQAETANEKSNPVVQIMEEEEDVSVMSSFPGLEVPKADVNLTKIINETTMDEQIKDDVHTEGKEGNADNNDCILDPVTGEESIKISMEKDSSVNEPKRIEDILEDSKPDSPSENTSFQQQEAELNAFLNDKKPKPKRKTVADLLKNMPGFDKIANIKPKVGGGSNSKAMIDFGDDSKKTSWSKNEKGIHNLMDRFVRHACASAVQPTSEEHVKLHIRKTEKDSQGLLHSVVDEIDYVTPAATEEEVDIIAKHNMPSGMSPQEQVPGQKMFRLKAALREQIWNKKAKEYQEKLKLHAMYNEEKELDDKISDDELPEDEEIMDEDVELSSDSEEDEELNDIPIGKQKKRKRLLYVEDEAEDDEADGEASDEDDSDEIEADGDNEDSKSLIDDVQDVDLDDEIDGKAPEYDKPEENSDNIMKVGGTPVISAAAVLNQKSSSDFWLNHREVSPQIAVDQLSDPIVQLVGNNPDSSDNLTELCSGQFPSQAPATPYETQTCFGFDIDSEDDQELLESCDKAMADSQQVKASSPVGLFSTPTGNTENPRTLALNSDTPKMTDKVVRSRSLGQRFEIEARKMRDEEDSSNSSSTPKVVERVNKIKLDFGGICNDESDGITVQNSMGKTDESDEEGEIGVKIIKKGKKLTFSDDEDDDEAADTREDVEENESDLQEEEGEEPVGDYDDEEGELERQLVLQAETPVAKGLFGKDGRLKKKFFENEAEISGSEEDSGDEDERGLNFYEREDGDEEDIDEDAVRSQVEKAHLKHLLDKDDREIRRLQEEYLERGDLEDGKLRERKFRWNNVDDAFTDELARMGDSDGELEEDEEEVKKKLAEIERRKWIHEHSELFEAAEEESQKMIVGKSKFLKLGKSTMRKIESFVENTTSFIMNESSNSVTDPSISSLVNSNITFNAKMMFATNKKDEDDPFKLSKATSQPLFASPDEPISKIKKGSFLSRGGTTLSRLAEITKVNDGPGTNVKSNSRNFVFSVVTPPDPSKLKGPKRPAHSQGAGQPKKMARMDRSFSNLDDSSKDASIFKWM